MHPSSSSLFFLSSFLSSFYFLLALSSSSFYLSLSPFLSPYYLPSLPFCLPILLPFSPSILSPHNYFTFSFTLHRSTHILTAPLSSSPLLFFVPSSLLLFTLTHSPHYSSSLHSYSHHSTDYGHVAMTCTHHQET